MPDPTSLIKKLESVLIKDSRYKIEAYDFILGAVDYTLRKLKAPRHVSGQELLEGIRKYALGQFGSMSPVVFEHWGVKTCEDFGNIVFNLIEAGLLNKTEKDSIDDFKGGYDFSGAFGED